MALSAGEITTLTAARSTLNTLIAAWEAARTASLVGGISLDAYRAQVGIMERKAHEMLAAFDTVRELFPQVCEREIQGASVDAAMTAITYYIPEPIHRKNVILSEFTSIRQAAADFARWNHRHKDNAYDLAVFAVAKLNILLA